MGNNILLTYINVIVSATVLFFIIWDHLKDDRQLTRQIQDFYNDIEMLIYTFIQVMYYKAIENKDIEIPDLKTLNKTRNRDNIQNSYLRIKILQNFNKYSEYVGLTLDNDIKSYINNTIYILSLEGLLRKRDFEKNTINDVINSYIKIGEDELADIQKFLNSLRFYWNKHYKKFIFRRGIGENMNFRETLGISIPLEKLTRKRKLRIKKLS